MASLVHTSDLDNGTLSSDPACWLCSCVYLEDETLWAGELVVPHGLAHEQEQQAGQEGQHDEDQAHDLGSQEKNKHVSCTIQCSLKRYSSNRRRASRT